MRYILMATRKVLIVEGVEYETRFIKVALQARRGVFETLEFNAPCKIFHKGNEYDLCHLSSVIIPLSDDELARYLFVRRQQFIPQWTEIEIKIV